MYYLKTAFICYVYQVRAPSEVIVSVFNLNWVDCLIFMYSLDGIVKHSQ